MTNKFGSIEKIKVVSKAKLVTEIKSRKLTAPVVKDDKLKQLFIDAFNKKYSPYTMPKL